MLRRIPLGLPVVTVDLSTFAYLKKENNLAENVVGGFTQMRSNSVGVQSWTIQAGTECISLR